MPVSPFITDRIAEAKYWAEKTWADCDEATVWQTVDDKSSGFYPTWKSDDASLFFENSYLKVCSDTPDFTVSPVLNIINDSDYSSYGKMVVSLRNTGKNDVVLDEIKFNKNGIIFYSPAVCDTASRNCVIPADGEWHEVSFDLNKLYLLGNEKIFTSAAKRLNKVTDINFRFKSDGENSEINIDNIRFYPSVRTNGTGFFEYISTFFNSFIEIFLSLFN